MFSGNERLKQHLEKRSQGEPTALDVDRAQNAFMRAILRTHHLSVRRHRSAANRLRHT